MKKKLRIFLMGGTKESINLIKYIKRTFDSYILTTTTTEYGAKLALDGGSDETIAKPLLKDEIISILKDSDFNIFIDATHPYASHVTRTAMETSKICKIPYIRFERPTLNFENIDNKNIYHVNSFEDAGKLIEKKWSKLNILHLAGSNTMKDVLKYVSPKYFYPRVLNVKSSVKKCEELNIPKNHVVLMNSVSTEEENKKLIDETNAKVIITKESGETGGVLSKINAANKKNIAIIMVDRPKIKNLDKEIVVSNLEDLGKEILKL